MNLMFDTITANHFTEALAIEMAGHQGLRHPGTDVIFMCGPEPTGDAIRKLAEFASRKNYNLIYAGFDPSNVSAGVIGYHVVFTDGSTQWAVLQDCKLWKRTPTSPAVLLFPNGPVLIEIGPKGLIHVREKPRRCSESGFEFASKAVARRAAEKPGHAAAVFPIGGMPAVIDSRTMAMLMQPA